MREALGRVLLSSLVISISAHAQQGEGAEGPRASFVDRAPQPPRSAELAAVPQDENWRTTHSPAADTAFALLAPAVVIGTSSLVYYGAGHGLGLAERAWLPTALTYWGLMGTAVATWGDRREVAHWLSAPKGSGWWYVADFAVGSITLPIILTNTSLVSQHPDVAAANVGFSLVNPWFEEAFWRGLLLDHTHHWPTWLRVVYSSTLFAASHPLIWGVYSHANRTPEVLLSTLSMGLVWSLSYEYQESLAAVVPAHFVTDISNLAVYTFLNLYDPPSAFSRR